MILLSFSVLNIKGFSQPYFYDEIPTIFKIDMLEQEIIESDGIEKLRRFYEVFENGSSTEADIKFRETALSYYLNNKTLAFIINGWLYVMSYEPNTSNSINDNDYRDTGKPFFRKVFIYKKNVLNRTKWELANFNPVFNHGFGHSLISHKICFNPMNTVAGGTSKVIMLPAYKDVVVLFVGMSIWWNHQYYASNAFLVLTPNYREDGSIFFDINTLDLPIERPIYFAGIINGRIIETNEKGQNGKLKRITIEALYNRNDEIERINIDGDYGFSNAGVKTEERNGKKYIIPE